MASESETHRMSLDQRLTRIEERVGQLLLDRNTILNAIANLRTTVQQLQNYKLKMETRDKDADKRGARHLAIIGTVIVVLTLVAQIVFYLYPRGK